MISICAATLPLNLNTKLENTKYANIKSSGSPGNKMKAVRKFRKAFCKLNV